MIKRNPKKILLTGGHAATAAYATVEGIKKRGHFKDIFWIGTKNALEGKSFQTLESQILPPLGVTTYWIPGGRIQRKFTIWTIPSLLKIPLSFLMSLFFIIKIKPHAVLSFGGGASFPVVLASFLLGVPVLIHEQTAVAGRANEISSFFAKKIILSRVSSLEFFPREKSEVLGNPVRKEILEIKPKKTSNIKTIFITGGSRGSQALNNLVKPILKNLLANYKIIHQTGSLEFENFSKIKSELSVAQNSNYDVYPTLDLSQMAKGYEDADVVVARAGANTVSEILITKRPAVLIPIPWSYKNEQNLNAQYAQNLGFVKIISQDSDPQALLEAINEQIMDVAKIRAKYSSFDSEDLNASQKIAIALEGI